MLDVRYVRERSVVNAFLCPFSRPTSYGLIFRLVCFARLVQFYLSILLHSARRELPCFQIAARNGNFQHRLREIVSKVMKKSQTNAKCFKILRFIHTFYVFFARLAIKSIKIACSTTNFLHNLHKKWLSQLIFQSSSDKPLPCHTPAIVMSMLRSRLQYG